jgi:hypothetical protein
MVSTSKKLIQAIKANPAQIWPAYSFQPLFLWAKLIQAIKANPAQECGRLNLAY